MKTTLLLSLLLTAFTLRTQARPGDLDPLYGSGGIATAKVTNYSSLGGAAVQADGKLVVVGTAQYFDGGNGNTANDPFVARFNTDGSLDKTFGNGGSVMTRFIAPGQDPNKNETGYFNAVAIQSDGKIVAAGHTEISYCCSFGYSDPVVARYNPDGSLDSSFGTGGKVFTNTDTGVFQNSLNGGAVIQALALATDGTIYAVGGRGVRHLQDGTVPAPALIIKYSSSGGVLGMVFPNYSPADKAKYSSAPVLQPDGKLIVNIAGGDYGGASVIVDFVLMRFNPDLSVDTSFGTNGVVVTDFGTGTEEANGVVLDPSGTVTVSGSSASSNDTGDCFAARYTASGALDSSFGNGGKVIIAPSKSPFVGVEGQGIARQADGKYLIALGARYGGLGAIRLLPNGALDATFGYGGIANYQTADPNSPYPTINGNGGQVLLQPDGKILLPASDANNVDAINGIKVLRLLNGAQLLNISTRAKVLTGDNILIGGFIITGSDTKKIAIRGIGPSLSLSGTLADPVLELHDGAGNIIATNDNWKINDATGQSQEADVRATTIPPSNDAESFILPTLPSGGALYTAVVKGKNNTTGIGQFQVYDLSQTADAQLANVSTRGFIDTGDNVMIGGIISGNGIGSSRIILRAIGPSLGVNGALQDPTLELHNSNGDLIASNDNWQDDANASQVQANGIAPKDTRESAIYTTLPPAAYTAIVRGKNNTTGIGLVEVYNLQ